MNKYQNSWLSHANTIYSYLNISQPLTLSTDLQPSSQNKFTFTPPAIITRSMSLRTPGDTHTDPQAQIDAHIHKVDLHRKHSWRERLHKLKLGVLVYCITLARRNKYIVSLIHIRMRSLWSHLTSRKALHTSCNPS